MIQGVNKEYIFKDEAYIREYLRIVGQNLKEYNIEVMAYCIMNNHAHFLIYTDDIQELGKFMHKTNLLFAKKYNKEKERVGVLFRNRYRTEPIYDERYLLNCIKYIHDNPVKAKMVDKCEDYPFSSYRDFMLNTGVTQNEIMRELFGSHCDYIQIFKELDERRFIEIDDDNKGAKEYIESGIREFKKEYSIKLIDIFHDRYTLKQLIIFLRNSFGIKNVEIYEYFGITKGLLQKMK